MYLYNKIGRGNVSREGAEINSDSPFLMGCQLGIFLIIQRDTGKGPSNGGGVTGVDLLENDWEGRWMDGQEEKQ